MSSFSVLFRTVPTPTGEARVLVLSGELDAHTAPEFEAALQRALDDGHARLIADGAELDYVSSAGLGVFMAFLEPARDAGGDLVIAALPARVYDVFDLLGFPALFAFEPSVEAAAARFTDAPPVAGSTA